MKNILTLGAGSNEVTGSSNLITTNENKQVLIDFGMFQGNQEIEKKNYELLSFQPSSLEAVFLTHAHLDHSGRLPLLVYGGYFGNIYMTLPTKELVEIILNDSARISMKDEPENPLYTTDEVQKVMKLIKTVDYNSEIDTGSFKAIFRDAGHILGSSSIEITEKSTGQMIIFSGDLGNTPQMIVKPTQYVDSADFVVMESTYGDSDHPIEDPSEIIQKEINIIEESGGVLLIPVFAIERTQEVLHIIHHLKNDNKVNPQTKVFLDSPMGINATLPYLHHKGFQNIEIQKHTTIPFNFENLIITDDSRDSKEIININNPKVIIAGSGMMSGGRILHHALNYLSDKSTRVLFVGYQAEETLGRKILEGKRSVVIDGVHIQVNAHISEIKTLSSHADQKRLLNWLSHIREVKKVFLTHGEKNQREVLAEKIKDTLDLKDVILPENNASYSL